MRKSFGDDDVVGTCAFCSQEQEPLVLRHTIDNTARLFSTPSAAWERTLSCTVYWTDWPKKSILCVVDVWLTESPAGLTAALAAA